MDTPEKIKEMVREKYATIAEQSTAENAASCCGIDSSCAVDYTVFSEDYTKLSGYIKESDLSLGCGIPVAHARISEGQTIVDLGSGAGMDAFVARSIVGPHGKVIGIDMTPVMIEKAQKLAKELQFDNVKFRLGDIEAIPMAANEADVVVSNCVLNLVPDKAKAFAEIHRILKPTGHFCISDVVLKGNLPPQIREAAEMYAGCVSGALQKSDYMGIIHETGFQNVSIKKERQIQIPDAILRNYMDDQQLAEFHASGAGVFSITVYAEKASCDKTTGCC